MAATMPTSTAGTHLVKRGSTSRIAKHPQPDHQRRSDGAVEAEHEGLDLGPETLGVSREAEQLGQLADDDDDRQSVHVADLHLVGEQVGDEAEPPDRPGRSR